MRSVLRWLVRLVVGALALLVVGAASVLVLAHTGWGREQLRARIEEALRGELAGGARVGALDGSLLGTLRLRDVELVGRDHQPRVTVGTLHARVALWPLVVHTLRVETLVADDVRVRVRREPARIEPARASPPSPWRVELPHLEVHRAELAIDAGGTTQTLGGIELAAAGTIDAGAITLFGWSQGRWDARAWVATAAVAIDGTTRVPAALVSLGGATLAANGLTIDLDHPRGAIAVSASAGELARLVTPELARLGSEVVATVALAPGAAPAETRLALDARAGQARLWVSLDGEPARRTARGVVSAVGLDLARLTHGRLCGRGDALAVVEASAARMRGTLVVQGDLLSALDRAAGSPCVAPRAPAQDAIVAIDTDFDRATTILLGGGEDGLELSVFATGHREAGAIVLDEASGLAHARAVDVAGRRVTGRLAVDATATGALYPARDVRITGSAAGEAVAIDDVSLRSARARFSLQLPAGIRRGTAQLTATGIRRGGTWIEAARADLATELDGRFRLAARVWPRARGIEIAADALVTPGDGRIDARLDRTRVSFADGTRWDGTTGSLRVTDASITLGDVRLQGGGATVALRGGVSRATGQLEARVEADRLAASAIDARYRGLGSGRVRLARRGGVWSLDGTIALSGFAVAHDAAAVDGTAHLVLAGRRVTLDARASSPALGDVELAFEALGPPDPFEPRAWRALASSAVRNATITLRRVALEGIGRLAGITAPNGTIDGAVNLAPASLTGAFAIRGVRLPFAAFDAELVFAPRDGDLGVATTVRFPDVADLAAVARLGLPRRPFERATWTRHGRDLVKQAAAELDHLAFDPQLLARLGIARRLAASGIELPYRGTASVALALDGAAQEARLAIDLADLTGGAIVRPVAPRIAISARPSGTHVRAELSAGQLALGVLEGELAMSTDRWLEEPRAALHLPITARWVLPKTPIQAVLAILGRDELAAGTLEGAASIRGTLEAPIVPSARLEARQLVVAPRQGGRKPAVFEQLAAEAAWSGTTGTLEVRGRQASGGELHARVAGRPDALSELTGSLTARQLDLSPLAVLAAAASSALPDAIGAAAGIVDAELALRAGRRVSGKLHVASGVVPLTAAIGTLRDTTADVTLGDRTIHATLDGALGRGRVKLTAITAADATTTDAALTLANVSPIAALRPIISAEVRAKLRRDGTQVVGHATISRARVTLPEHAETSLLDPAVPRDLVFVGAPAAIQPDAPAARARPWLSLDVQLDPTQIEAPDAIEGVGFKAVLQSDDLHVSIGDRVGIDGSVAIDHADVVVLGRRYLVEPSDLLFDGTTDPRLRIHMSHAFPSLTLLAEVTGRASKPELRLAGEPGGYSPDQLFGFFVGGEPGGDPSSQTREAVTGAASVVVSSRLGRQLNRVLPVKLDAVACEPATTASSGSCTVGKWLSPRLFLAYRQHLASRPDENTGDVQVQLRMGPRALIEGSGGDRGYYGADLLWRHRW